MEKVVSCTQCGSQNPNDAQFCIMCGSSLTQVATGPTEKLAAFPCPSCKALSPSDARFCVSCGHTLNQVATAYAPSPSAQILSQMSPQPISKTLPKQSSRNPTSQHPNVGMLIIIGLFLYFVLGISWWWMLLIFLIYHGLFKKHTGISKSHIKGFLWLIGIYLLLTTGSFWPIILSLFFLSMVLDHIL